MPAEVFCDVAVPHARLAALTYRFDPGASGQVRPGDCVQVPLRGRRVKGLVVRTRSSSPVPAPRPIDRLVARGLVDEAIISLAYRMADYYWARLGEVFGRMLPKNVCGYRPRGSEVWAPEAIGEDRRAVGGAEFGVTCLMDAGDRLESVARFVGGGLHRGSVITLFPESQLDEWQSALNARLGQKTVGYHGRLTPTELKKLWLRLGGSAHRVVAGTRSAVFAPVRDLAGIVVVDGHDPVYKEERYPRYNARDVAVFRGQADGCPVLFCDRTPSAETWWRMEQGTYRSEGLPARTGRSSSSFVVDARRGGEGVISPRLDRELAVLGPEETAVLYVNRRGISRHVVCDDCGAVLLCPLCAVPEKLRSDGRLECGYCGQERAAPARCPDCASLRFRYRVPGVDLIARELERLLPGRRVLRVTQESAGDVVAEGGAILVGTRALLGVRWPVRTKLVCSACHDYDVALPDFRARERAFQTLFELERRGRFLKARLIVQTRRPEEPSIACALEQDVASFMADELSQRRALGFPPFRQLAVVEFRGSGSDRAAGQARRTARCLARTAGVDAVGPIEVRRPQQSRAVWRLLLRADPGVRLSELVSWRELEAGGVEVRVDVDPQTVV